MDEAGNLLPPAEGVNAHRSSCTHPKKCEFGEHRLALARLLQWHLACSFDSVPPSTNVFAANAVRRLLLCRTPVPFLIVILFVAGIAAAATPARTAGRKAFTALAYSIEGKSAGGSKSGLGTVAADPNVLRLGSKIRVSGAGAYSGDYTVVDSGGRIKGNVIDIYVSSVREARKFGKKKVEVEILEQSRPHTPRGE